MPKFGKASLAKLNTCDNRLKQLMNAVIEEADIKIEYGHRTPEEQLALFKKGRVFKDGKWVKIGATVTDKDGTARKSKHNHYPSLAVDVLPYPFKGWKDLDQFIELNKVVMRKAKELGIEIVWGADWDGDGNIKEHSLQDYPHYELKA